MSIVLPLAHSVHGYLRQYGRVAPNLPLRCSHCDTQPLHRHGCYWRGVVCRRRIYRIPIYRWKCPSCRRTVSVLPDFLKPYARFLSLLREKAVWRRLAGWQWERIAVAVSSLAVSVVSVRTLLRWFRRAVSWAAGRGAEPVGRLIEAAPSLDVGAFKPSDTTPVALLQFIRQTGHALQHQVGRLERSHPGLYALFNSLLGGPPYL
jgi:hypothetical protein